MRNPYIVGQVVYRPHFYGRQSLVDDILDERKQCIYLIGNRRIGKTSLLRYLEDTVGFPTIYLNLQSTMGDPARMKRELIRRVNEKTRQIPLFEKIDLSTAGDICDVVNILATAAELNGTMIFQLWDEAEILLGLDTNFLGRLRSAIHEKRHLRTILAASRNLKGINEQYGSRKTPPFLFGSEPLYVSVLSNQEAADLICQVNNPEGRVRVDPELLNQILENTGNHPYLTHFLCHRLFKSSGELRPIMDDDLILSDELIDLFKTDFNSLSQLEQAILVELSKRGILVENELCEVLAITAEQVKNCLYDLDQLGFIRRMPGENYQIANYFLLTWLTMGKIDRGSAPAAANMAINRWSDDPGATKTTSSPPPPADDQSASKEDKKPTPVSQDKPTPPVSLLTEPDTDSQARGGHTILLVTVTKIEAQSVLEAFPNTSGVPWKRRYIGDKTYYTLGKIGGVDVYMVQSEMGTATSGGALLTIHKAIEALSPIAVIMVGIAFGSKPKSEENPDGQELGDILVARQIMAYEPGRVKDKFTPRGDRVTCSTILLDKFRSGELDWKGAPVRFGLVLSGEKLVNNQAFRKKLLKLEPEAIGGEMEGAGLYTAANDAKVDWILVKAICDWADGNKDDKAQPLAASNAAAFVLHVLKLDGWGSMGG